MDVLGNPLCDSGDGCIAQPICVRVGMDVLGNPFVRVGIYILGNPLCESGDGCIGQPIV